MVQYQWVNQPPPTTMMIRLLVYCYTIYIYIYYRAAEIKEILLEKYQHPDIDGLVQHWSNSTAKALRLLQFCTKPSKVLSPRWWRCPLRLNVILSVITTGYLALLPIC